MATLEKIRSKAGLLVVVVGVALFAFIIGDGLRSGSTFVNQSKETVLSVNGKSVKIQEFQNKVLEMEEVYKMQSGSSSIPEDVQIQIRESVFESLVREMLLAEEASKVGFAVGKDELRDLVMGENISPMIQQMPMFRNPQTGAFDRNAFINFLQTIESDDVANQSPQMYEEIQRAKAFWSFYEKTIKQQKLEEKFTSLISKAVVPNSLEVKAAFEDAKVNVDIDYAAQLYSSIADDQVSVSDAEIQELYKKRKELFKQDEAMLIDYISVQILPSEDDYNKAKEILEKIKPEFTTTTSVSDIVNDNSEVPYANIFKSLSSLSPESKRFAETANLGDVEGPFLEGNTYHMLKMVDKKVDVDSVKVYQMTMPQLEEAALKNLTDSLANEINGGKSFADVARAASNGQSDGLMGWMTEESLLKSADENFKNEVFNAPLNKVSVVKSAYGTHLVQVTERTAPVAKYKLADIQIEVTPSSETNSKLFNDLTHYVATNNTMESFKSEAQKAGYQCNVDVPVGKNDQMIGTVKGIRPVVKWAYEKDKGAISDVFECHDNFMVVAVKGRQEEGYRPVSAVAEILKRELINDKKAEKIIAELNTKKQDSIAAYAEVMASTVQSVKYLNFSTNRISGMGFEPIISAYAPLAEVGEISAPLKGKNAVYVFKVTDKKVSEEKFDMNAQRQSLTMNESYRLAYQSMQILRDKSEVEDYRIRFY